ncbi:DUF2235 domain-containing protein [Ciceribacter sp. RN22]|uniref:T6SS phospholipase effector Tle1-like catalytic domain-containing protein n=1 Tax=Ciceribacter sp. RN22 TaxID=2954932 RepID=UPI00209301BE|nr:DUF2235 domain-containing protein [Ciceribacter sp. RN22]MCO6178859.1 DUF2235 domain-containing protein [Ciceribacter sp. RN22]
MAKNIVLLFDGTSNEIAEDRTNILRLFGALKRNTDQIVYYDPGVGTFGAVNAWLKPYRDAVEIWGMGTGWGLDQNVKDAYRFIVENYESASSGRGSRKDGEDDHLFLFGFSRGAYAARVLAGFIHALGLVSRHNLNLVDYAYSAYKAIPDFVPPPGDAAASEDTPSAFSVMRLHERALKTYRPKIRMLGLFDTVGSVIEHGSSGVRLKTHPFTRRNPSVEIVRHALAIDERRTMFRPQYWEIDQPYWGSPFRPKDDPPPQDVKEVWFTGCHGDVGGGHPERESALIKVPLAWMIREATGKGLKVITRTVNEIVLGQNPQKPYVAPDPKGPAHDSMNPAWRLLEFVPRRIPDSSWRRHGIAGGIYVPLSDPRFIPDDALVHQSVVDRLGSPLPEGPYAPENLPARYRVES